MTTTFDKREEGFEKKFAHDEELKFKASARRNKLLGMWAAEKLGLTGAQAEAYAKEVVMADFEKPGDQDVFAKSRKDFDGKKVAVTDLDIRRAMDELMAQAIAAHAGLRGRLLGKPTRPGVLLGTRSYRADSPSFPAGARLLVSARIASADESGFGAYECSIRGPAGPLASATLKIFAPEDFAAFLQSAQ